MQFDYLADSPQTDLHVNFLYVMVSKQKIILGSQKSKKNFFFLFFFKNSIQRLTLELLLFFFVRPNICFPPPPNFFLPKNSVFSISILFTLFLIGCCVCTRVLCCSCVNIVGFLALPLSISSHNYFEHFLYILSPLPGRTCFSLPFGWFICIHKASSTIDFNAQVFHYF